MWANFKKHFIEADKKRRKAINASADGKVSHNDFANNAEEISPVAISAMFASVMGSFAETAEESIHTSIESKFNTLRPPNSQTMETAPRWTHNVHPTSKRLLAWNAN